MIRIVMLALAMGTTLKALDAGTLPRNVTGVIIPSPAHLSIDGELSEWSKRPMLGLGCDHPFEKYHSGYLRLGWDAQGLTLAMRAFDDSMTNQAAEPGNYFDGDALELYLDLRDSLLGSESYSEGAYQFILVPRLDSTGAPAFHLANWLPGTTDYDASGTILKSQFRKNGWTLEGRIPWSVFGKTAPPVNKVLHVTASLGDADGGRRKRLWERDANSMGPGNFRDPSFWPAYQIVEASKEASPLPVDFQVVEEWFLDVPWLSVDIALPMEEYTSPPRVLLEMAGAINADVELHLQKSPGGRFWWARQRFALPWDAGGASTSAKAQIKADAKGNDSDTLTVTAKMGSGANFESRRLHLEMLSMLRHIDSLLPESDFRELEQRVGRPDLDNGKALPLRLARLLQSCAREKAGTLRAGLKQTDATFEAQGMARIARRILDGDSVLAPSQRPYMNAYQSPIDGSWQPFRVLGWETLQRDSKQKPPLVMSFHGYDKVKCARSNWVWNRMRHLDPLYQTPDVQERGMDTEGGGFKEKPALSQLKIDLLSRGNSPISIGREDFEILYHWGKKNLPIDTSRILASGFSLGGMSSMLYGLWYPDRFSSIVSRSGAHVIRPHRQGRVEEYDPSNSRLEGPARYYREMSGRDDKVMNLRNQYVFLSCGDLDPVCIEPSRRIADALNREGALYQYAEVEGGGHHMPKKMQRLPPDAVWEHRIPHSPRHVALRSAHPGFAESHWLRLDALDTAGVAGEAIATLVYDSELRIQTANLRGLTLHPTLPVYTTREVRIVLDGENHRFPMVPPEGLSFRRESGDTSWTVGAFAASRGKRLYKRKGLSGPMGEMEAEGFLLVYGTLSDADMLRRRAESVARSLTGSEIRQWSGGRFVVKADKDVTAAEIRSRNLWCVGHAGQNALVERAAKKGLPFPVDAKAIRIGSERYDGDVAFKFMVPNPLATENYLLVDLALTAAGFNSNPLAGHEWDYSVIGVDGVHNAPLVQGLLDSDWSYDTKQPFTRR